MIRAAPDGAQCGWVYCYGSIDTCGRLSYIAPPRIRARAQCSRTMVTLDYTMVSRPGNTDIQLDLFLDYANNVKLYPAFQEYFRKAKPPLLAIWGKHDPFFIPPGAEAYRRDNPNAQVQFLDTGHFALETHVEEVAAAMREFLEKHAG